MFDWFWNRVEKRIGDTIISRIESWLEEPKNINQLTKLTDALVDRQMHRVMSSLGAAQKGVGSQPSIAETPFDVGDLLGKGGISSKKLVGIGLKWALEKYGKGGQNEANSGRLP